MGQIYSLAWRVIVWSGEDDSNLAETAIETINWFVKDCCSTIEMKLDEIDLSSGSKSDDKIRNVYSMSEAINRPTPIQTPDEWKALEWFFEDLDYSGGGFCPCSNMRWII
jgi:hypothetical protein